METCAGRKVREGGREQEREGGLLIDVRILTFISLFFGSITRTHTEGEEEEEEVMMKEEEGRRRIRCWPRRARPCCRRWYDVHCYPASGE